jgi:hypothetical protein
MKKEVKILILRWEISNYQERKKLIKIRSKSLYIYEMKEESDEKPNKLSLIFIAEMINKLSSQVHKKWK